MAKIWYLGHSTLQLEIDGVRIVTDPFISDNPKSADINVSDVEADIILVSHGHGDHVGDLVELAKTTDAEVISCFEITTWLENQGHSNVRPMNIGGNYVSRGIRFKMVNAVHSSSFPDGSYAGNPAGFILEGQNDCIYFAGDTALTYDMKLINEEFELTGALLPIGDNFTMGPDDALKAAQMCGTDRVVGIHFDTFGFIEIDHEQTEKLFEDAGIELFLPNPGEELEI